MEIETRFVLKRSPKGEIIRTLPMVLPADATIADVLEKAEFSLDAQSVWVNGMEVDIKSKAKAQVTVTVFLELAKDYLSFTSRQEVTEYSEIPCLRTSSLELLYGKSHSGVFNTF